MPSTVKVCTHDFYCIRSPGLSFPLEVDGRTRTGKWVLFILPLVTVLREGLPSFQKSKSKSLTSPLFLGLEAVIFVGGVSLGLPATSIPIAAIVGIVCGLVIGFFIYEFASRTSKSLNLPKQNNRISNKIHSALSIFLVVMTNFLLLIGAGLFSKGVGSFETHAFNVLLGTNADDAGGNGPGTYRVQGNVWHLDCCSPENGQGWSIFNAILGWTNNATGTLSLETRQGILLIFDLLVGTVLAYVFYWLAVIVALVYTKYKEV